MSDQAVNPLNQSYTKYELRLILKNPNVNLSRPGKVEPISHYILRARVKKLLKRLGDNAHFTIHQWKGWRQVPASICYLILSEH